MRTRLVRQLLTESLLLALIGGLLGVGFAWVGLKGVQALLTLAPRSMIPEEAVIAINVPVLVFAIVISTLAVLIFSLAPALESCRYELARTLGISGRTTAGGVRQRWLRNGSVVLEVSVSLILLAGVSLMLRTLLAIQRVDFGIHTENVLTARIPLNPKIYPDSSRRVAFFQEILERLNGLPGVIATGLNTELQLFNSSRLLFSMIGSGPRGDKAAGIHHVNDNYVKAVGIPLVRGRLFTKSDLAGRQHLALVNEAFARRFLPDGYPIGRLITFPRLHRLRSMWALNRSELWAFCVIDHLKPSFSELRPD